MWFIIRHGETLHNRRKIKQGRYNSMLTLKGVDQIRSIAYRMSVVEEDFSKYTLCSSPMVRTLHSMQIIQEVLDLEEKEVEQDVLLSEVDAGDYTNKKKSEILAEDPDFLKKKELDFWNFSSPNGETYNQVYDRMEKFVHKHKDIDENLIILTHGCGVRFITSILSGLKKEEYKQENSVKINQNYFYCWNSEEGVIKL